MGEHFPLGVERESELYGLSCNVLGLFAEIFGFKFAIYVERLVGKPVLDIAKRHKSFSLTCSHCCEVAFVSGCCPGGGWNDGSAWGLDWGLDWGRDGSDWGRDDGSRGDNGSS